MIILVSLLRRAVELRISDLDSVRVQNKNKTRQIHVLCSKSWKVTFEQSDPSALVHTCAQTFQQFLQDLDLRMLW